MLGSSRRLRAAQVRDVLRTGSRARSTFLSARFVEVSQGKEAFAAVVPNRVAKTAVRRNKFRRLLYATLKNTPLPPVRAAILLEKLPPEGKESLLASDLASLFSKVGPRK